MRLLEVFSNNLREQRHVAGLSQNELAQKAGLHRTYISALERGKRSIAIDNVEKIARALGVDAQYLFARKTSEDSNNTD